jgi:Trk K+ transport system NAD-binding subunit
VHSPSRAEESAFDGHVIVCGLDGLGLRTVEDLRRLDEAVVVVVREAERFAGRARALGAGMVHGDFRDEDVLRLAGAERARAVVLVEDDDVGNIHAALTAQEINPAVRVVLRVFNQPLGGHVAALFRDAAVISSSAIAAPAFVSAALDTEPGPQFEVAGRRMVFRQGAAADGGVILPLAHTSTGGHTDLFPRHGDDLLCLIDGGPARRTRETLVRARMRGVAGDVVWIALTAAGRRMRWLVLVLALLTVLSSLIFARFAGLSAVDAVYFTVTVITTTGFGDINMRDESPALKLYANLLMLLGAAALAVLYALLTDAIVTARLARAGIGPARHIHDHVIVCGLGNIGFRIVDALVDMGVPVVAVEHNESVRAIAALRRRRVPILIGDSRSEEILRNARVGDAACLVAATSDDVANLEAALNARAMRPDLRVVLRLFDSDLAARVERSFGISVSRTVSGLSAPAFAAAATGRRVLASVAAGNEVLLFAQARVQAGAPACGATVDAIERIGPVRVVATLDGDRPTWRPQGDHPLREGHEVVIVATRAVLGSALSWLSDAATGDVRTAPAEVTYGPQASESGA